MKGGLVGMDNDRRPRHTPSGYASQQSTLLPPQASYPVVSAPDRFRQPPLTAPAPPTSLPSSGSRASPQGYGYGYGESAQFGSSVQSSNVSYSAQDYGTDQQQQQQQQQQVQRTPQQYSPYGQNIMYGTQASATGSSQYESVEQYQQNRDSAIQVLSTGFGVAQQQYYEGGPTSAPAATIASQSVTSQYPSLAYTASQTPVGREALAPAYSAAGMTDPNQATSQAGYPQANYSDSQSGGGGGGGGNNDYDDFYRTYQSELKKTFEHVRDSRLSEAGTMLFRMSDWLLHFAETLGLVRDDETYYQQRLQLWEEFNTCWLSTLQKQKVMTQEMINTGQRPQAPTSLIDHDFLEKMGTQLVKNCDGMEKHGLVDYQMGVWEEEIVAMLTCCMDLLEEVGAGPLAQRPTSTARRR